MNKWLAYIHALYIMILCTNCNNVSSNDCFLERRSETDLRSIQLELTPPHLQTVCSIEWYIEGEREGGRGEGGGQRGREGRGGE